MDYNYVVVTRYGGIGDLLMIEPTIEALYYKFFPARIILRTYKDYKDVLGDHPLIWDTILDTFTCPTYGFPQSGSVETDLNGLLESPQRILHLNLSNAIENMNGLHGVDSFACASNVKLLRKTPSFGHFNFDINHKVVVQLRDTGDGRDLRREDLPMNLLEDAVFLEKNNKMSMTDYINVIAGADVFIGPDSSGLHIAHAAGVRRIVGLYTERFPAALRSYPGIQVACDLEELAWKISAALNEPSYPEWLNYGDAISHIKGKALLHCRGYGLDVGASDWPFPGAIAIHNENEREKFNEGPFDFLISSHCLEHIPDWQSELKLWASSVKVGGTVFIYLPHPQMEMWKPGSWWVGDNHVWSPEPNSLVHWLHENTDLKVEEYSCYPDAYWSFHIIARRIK